MTKSKKYATVKNTTTPESLTAAGCGLSTWCEMPW